MDKKKEIIEEIRNIQIYTNNDYESYKQIKNNAGSCSVGMISHSMAVMDWLSYLFFGSTPRVSDTNSRFTKLLKKYESVVPKKWEDEVKNPQLLYEIIRCGVVHQFYGKNTAIKRFDGQDYIICKENGRTLINPNGLFEMVLDILENSISWVNSSNESSIFKRLTERNEYDKIRLNKALSNMAVRPCANSLSTSPETTSAPSSFPTSSLNP